MNLDNYDKIPCSAKEACDWMSKGNFCVEEINQWLPMRINSRQVEYQKCGGEWEPNPILNTMTCDWMKLVPKRGLSEMVVEAAAKASNKQFAEGRNFSDRPGRFAAIDKMVDVHYGSDLESYPHDRKLMKAFARAIVELIEGERK